MRSSFCLTVHIGCMASLGLLPTCVLAQQAQQLPSAPLPASQTPVSASAVHGEVVYTGDIPDEGAEVTLIAGSVTLTATTDADGQFVFDAVPAGNIVVTVAQSGMVRVVAHATVQLGEPLTLSPIELHAATVVQEVDVRTPEREAIEQVHAEEKQRLFGVLPNFYVVYDKTFEPMPTRLKYQMAFRNLIDPINIGLVAATVGIQQANGDFSGFGTGPTAYGKRFGAGMADFTTGSFLSLAILPQVFKQDPRYFWKGEGTVASRTEYAVTRAVICRGDNDKWQPCYSLLLGSLGSAGISNIYYPASNRNGAGLTFANFGLNVASNAVGNIVQEFLLQHLTPKKHNHGADSQ